MQPGECVKLNNRCSELTTVLNAANFFKFMTLKKKQEANQAFGMKLVPAEKHSENIFKLCDELFKSV